MLISLAQRGGWCVLVIGEPRRRIRSGCLFFRPHHLIISCGGRRFRSHRLRVPPHPSVFSLLIEAAIVRRAEGVVSHPLSVSFLYELGKTARNVISCSIALGYPWTSRSSSRLSVSWGVSCRIVVVVFARCGCRVLRFCSLASRHGVSLAYRHR